MSLIGKLSVRLALGTLIALSVWGAAPGGLVVPRSAVAKPGEPFGTSLYMLEQTYGRTLMPLDPVTLSDYPYLNGVTVGAFSALPSAVTPTILASPNGSALAFVTYRCSGCSVPHAKFTTIRIVDTHTGNQLARFHPQVPMYSIYVADHGTRIAGLGQTPDARGLDMWYTLDGKTGRIIEKVVLSNCCGALLYDQPHSRIYVENVDTAHHLSVVAYDTTSGSEQAHVMLAGVAVGSWPTDRQVDGRVISHMSSPALALSPDGRRVAVLDSDHNTLTLINAPSMKVVSTLSVGRPQGLLARLADLLGIAPTSADAKEIEGTWLQMQYSRDGRSLLVTGTRGGFDAAGHFAFTRLGLQQIDAASGAVQGATLDGQDIWWMGQAADGSAVYTLTSTAKDDVTCPCTLRRHSPGSLDVTAERTFSVDTTPRLFIVGGN